MTWQNKLKPGLKRFDGSKLKTIAVLNFGGIGDEILFAPVLQALSEQCPQSEITLYLEDRSQAVLPLLQHVNSSVVLPIQKMSRFQIMRTLWWKLYQGSPSGKPYDMVLASGSSPFIALLLFFSGISIRVGFDSGWLSQQLLTVVAPLAPANNRKGYAATMYAALSSAFRSRCQESTIFEMSDTSLTDIPVLKNIPSQDLEWAKEKLCKRVESPLQKKVLIHPGVSQVSIEKNILKSWSPDCWATLIEQLLEDDYAVFLVGGPDDRHAIETILTELTQRVDKEKLAGFVNLFGETKSLLQLAALIVVSDVLIAVDSSPMHIAVGYQKPLVAIFGPTDEKKLLPPNSSLVKAVFVHHLTCRPCLWDKRKTSCEQPVCLDVPVQSVYSAVKALVLL